MCQISYDQSAWHNTQALLLQSQLAALQLQDQPTQLVQQQNSMHVLQPAEPHQPLPMKKWQTFPQTLLSSQPSLGPLCKTLLKYYIECHMQAMCVGHTSTGASSPMAAAKLLMMGEPLPSTLAMTPMMPAAPASLASATCHTCHIWFDDVPLCLGLTIAHYQAVKIEQQPQKLLV